MYLPILLALLGSAFSVPITPDTRNNDYSQYVLPGESRPTNYDVQLFLNPDNVQNFTGIVSIRVLPNRDTDVLVLHAMELTISEITVTDDRGGGNILFNYTLATDDTHLLRIQLNSTISQLVPHIVNISYSGKYAENMFGIYVSTYTNRNNVTESLITSQLQPTFARRAFPCYDEPHLKAIFRTTIYAPANYTVVRSNMPERSANETLKPDVAGWVKHEFEDTLEMSTYLIAYLVSNFVHIDNQDNQIYRIPFKVFSRNGTEDFAKYAMDFGQKNMVALENYTEFYYEFPKMDKVAVPDFAAGAMENWGLVIYREVALLVQENVTTTAIRQNIARIITHENMHQWFGNEVSPLSWTYTWLNEGFANFFENYATDLVTPGYRMMDQFVLQQQNVMQNDAVLLVNPMTHPVYTPSQIIGTFNAVAYQKSGSVIRMMQHFLTPEVFRKGLVYYIRANSRGAVGPSQLYASLQQALNESNHTIPFTVDTIMERWTTQGGFPVLNVRRSAPTAESVSVSQQRYLTDPTLTANDTWHVPVNWVLSTNPDFSDTRPQRWVLPTGPALAIDIPGLSNSSWFIFNKRQTGYYRVNYDVDNWVALTRVLRESPDSIDVLNRAQLIDDSFNLARNGRLAYLHPLEISRYLVNEKDYIPWASANTAFSYLDIVLSGTEVYSIFQKFVLNLTEPLYSELGFEPSTTEEHVTAFHRNIILTLNCRYGNEACVTRAQELLQNFRNNPSQRLHPDIQTTVFCSGLRGGNADDFNFLWGLYLASTDSSEQSIFLSSLGCTSNEDRLNFYMNQVISDDSPVRIQDRSNILVSVINASPENMDKAFDFIIENFHNIQPRVQGLSGTTSILNALARRLNSEEHRAKLNTFISRHGSILTAGEAAAVTAIEDNIAGSLTWGNDHLEIVEDWLEDNFGVPDGAASVTSSLILLVACVFAIFNYH